MDTTTEKIINLARTLRFEDLSPLAIRASWALSGLRLRPPRHAGSVPGMWYNPGSDERGGDMKRLRHWLFNFAAVVSLLLCVFKANKRLISRRVAKTQRGEFFARISLRLSASA